MKIAIPLYLIAIGIACIALQNAGIIRPYEIPKSEIRGSVKVTGGSTLDHAIFEKPVAVELKNSSLNVNVENFSDLSLDEIEANLSSVAGVPLVTSKLGANIGFESDKKTVIPINWGEFSISK